MKQITTIEILGHTYDLAVNGRAILAVERKDIYDRPYAHEVPLEDVSSVEFTQEVLNLLAKSFKDLEKSSRDLETALEGLRRESK